MRFQASALGVLILGLVLPSAAAARAVGYPPAEKVSGPPPEPDEEGRYAMEGAERNPTYGLVQLRGVPDGASVDLDGRFWLRADALGGRWLALPEGKHAIAVRAPGSEPAERRIVVTAGRSQVVRFGPFRHGGGTRG